MIKETGPTSIPKSHDVWKVGTSLNYFENLNLKGLQDGIHWKSVFVENSCIMLKTIGALSSSIGAAGSAVPPNQEDSGILGEFP